MKNLEDYEKYTLNESLPNPYIGFYNMSNGYMDGLLEELDLRKIEYQYDGYRNYCIIESNDRLSEISLLITGDEFGQGDGPEFSQRYLDDPNDCVFLKAKWISSPPPGAM